MTVEANSLYAAVFAYNAEQLSGSARHYPKLERDTAVEVCLADGRVFHTTLGRAMDWANRKRA